MEQLSTEEGCPEEEKVRKRGKKTAKMLFFNIFFNRECFITSTL